MAGIFRGRGRGSEPSEWVASEAVSSEPGLTFEPQRRVADRPARDRDGESARVSSSRVPRAERARPDAERGSAGEVARLSEDLKREQAEEARALAEAEPRLVQALAEQRTQLEAEARERVTEVVRLREELTRARAEIEAELATTRRQLAGTERQIAAMEQPSAHSARG
jgi:predicted RNase H-like nuclease (RuvC/YqgF family)